LIPSNTLLPLFIALFIISNSYKVLLDLNTFNATELLAVPGLPKDGIYAIHINSPGVTDEQWKAAIGGGGNPSVSEDNPYQFSECQWWGRLFNGPTYALGYHETAVEPNAPCLTLLTSAEVDKYHGNCNQHAVLALTRSYWPNSQWEKCCHNIMLNANLGGFAMEYNPHETGQRAEDHFINEVVGKYGKKVFFFYGL